MKHSYVFLVASTLSIPLYSVEQSHTTPSKASEEIPCTEDLMREHGILNRVLLIYEELINQIETNRPFDNKTAQEALQIIYSFIESYHEKLEEDYIFPLFEKAKVEVELVTTLRAQHTAGRKITQKLQELCSSKKITAQDRTQIKTLMHEFVTMYRPHEAREDTVLFPKVRSLLSQKEFEKLSDYFEESEKKLFGKDGFTSILRQVEMLEKKLGIYKLSQFTPRSPLVSPPVTHKETSPHLERNSSKKRISRVVP